VRGSKGAYTAYLELPGGGEVCLGLFKKKKEAARVVDEHARIDFARPVLNFLNGVDGKKLNPRRMEGDHE
jgi:hypothetical protein